MGTLDVEQRLREYATHRDSNIAIAFKQIPAYLRDIIYRSSSMYVERPINYDRLTRVLLSEHPHDVTFITANYDSLLEQALTALLGDEFDNLNKYIDPSRPAKVVKLHGSVNWFKYLSARPSGDWFQQVDAHDIFHRPPDGEVMVIDGVTDVYQHRRPDRIPLYPVITAPLAGKNPQDFTCPESHITAARQFLEECTVLLIIGCSGLDEDLLNLLNISLRKHHELLIHIVDALDNAYQVRDRFTRGVQVFQSVNIAVFDTGFDGYINKGYLAQLARGNEAGG